MRDHLQIDRTGIHILQTSIAKITHLRLQLGSECPTPAPGLARGDSLHELSEPIGQEMFFDRNCSHAHSSFQKHCFLFATPRPLATSLKNDTRHMTLYDIYSSTLYNF